MAKVLLTGGSGFIATHILQQLLQRGHSVVATVRSEGKAESIRKAYPDLEPGRLDFAIVPDVAQPNAFDEALVSNPYIEAVIHTASPFHFNVTDVQKDLLDPAINGTTGILKAIVSKAPQVKRVVITSSFGSMMDRSKGFWPEHTYSDADWCPLTQEEAIQDPGAGYQASKTFAERAAWDFVNKERPSFTLATICPPLVFGPALQSLNSLDSLNTSNQFIRGFIVGASKDEISPTVNPIFADVRDVALAHVMAMEKPGAAGKRFLVTGGYCSNREIVDIIHNSFPQYRHQLPPSSAKGGELPDPVFKFDNQPSKEILGIEYKTFEECIVDTVKSFGAFNK
ncbi:NADPH-dependent methylglyoxal reductase-like protein GRE2 [Corynespora cassiicola Philippines]|uniref:NADPH-dependent methylglyoxal reductase-like protein GRE2 n=1 Tax=Corynespora cassiicola Philippines TaxID=1448308 RepID=A0A2T2N6C0_CORCC|nr:NADPH-dependent methylglyoxal reductase-like protein GRE2 [Corynespora cassiicola Philippines]